jgi:hypothetical protein
MTQQQQQREEQPSLPFWLNWEVYKAPILFFLDVLIFSTLLLILSRIIEFLEVSRLRLFRNDHKIKEILYFMLEHYKADRVIVCEYRIPFKMTLRGDVYRITPVYEITRSGITSVSRRIKRSSCGTSIIQSFARNQFIVRKTNEISNPLYKAFMQSFEVKISAYCALDTPVPIGFVALHYCFSQLPDLEGFTDKVNELSYLLV